MTEYVVNETDAEGRPVFVLSFPPGRQVGPGEACSDIPKESVKSLLRRGVISPAEPTSTKKKEG